MVELGVAGVTPQPLHLAHLDQVGPLPGVGKAEDEFVTFLFSHSGHAISSLSSWF